LTLIRLIAKLHLHGTSSQKFSSKDSSKTESFSQISSEINPLPFHPLKEGLQFLAIANPKIGTKKMP
jgi:hypothetical protein